MRRPFQGGARTFIWGGIGLGLILLSFALDPHVAGLFHPQNHNALHAFAKFLSKIGDWPCLLLTGLAGVAWLLFMRRFELGRLCLLVLLAGMLSGFSATLVRTMVGRTRPDAPVPQGFYILRNDSRWVVGQYAFGSFPSGHTATVAGLTATAWLWRRRLGAGLGIFAVAVAWSRLALGCHHFSDVVAASVWGVAVGPWFFLWAEPRLKGQWLRLEAARTSLQSRLLPPAGRSEAPVWVSGESGIESPARAPAAAITPAPQ